MNPGEDDYHHLILITEKGDEYRVFDEMHGLSQVERSAVSADRLARLRAVVHGETINDNAAQAEQHARDQKEVWKEKFATADEYVGFRYREMVGTVRDMNYAMFVAALGGYLFLDIDGVPYHGAGAVKVVRRIRSSVVAGSNPRAAPHAAVWSVRVSIQSAQCIWYFMKHLLTADQRLFMHTLAISQHAMFWKGPMDLSDLFERKYGSMRDMSASAIRWMIHGILCTIDRDLAPLAHRASLIYTAKQLDNAPVHLIGCIASQFMFIDTNVTYLGNPDTQRWSITEQTLGAAAMNVDTANIIARMVLPYALNAKMGELMAIWKASGVPGRGDTGLASNLNVRPHSLHHCEGRQIFAFANGIIASEVVTLTKGTATDARNSSGRLRIVEAELSDFVMATSNVRIPEHHLLRLGGISSSHLYDLYGGNPEANLEDYERYMGRLLPGSDERVFFMRYIASVFFNWKLFKKMLFLVGLEGDEGKSVLTQVLKMLFGQNMSEISAMVIMKASFTGAANGHSAHLVKILEGIPFGLISDFPMESEIDASTMKKITGRDPITGRGAYGREEISRIAETTLLGIINNYPNMGPEASTVDRRRAAIIPLDGRYLPASEAPDTVEEQDRLRIWPHETFSPQRLARMAEHLLGEAIDAVDGLMRHGYNVTHRTVPVLLYNADGSYQEKREAAEEAYVLAMEVYDAKTKDMGRWEVAAIPVPQREKVLAYTLSVRVSGSLPLSHHECMAASLYDNDPWVHVLRRIICAGGSRFIATGGEYSYATPLPDSRIINVDAAMLAELHEYIPKRIVKRREQEYAITRKIERLRGAAFFMNVATCKSKEKTSIVLGFRRDLSYLV